MRIIFNSKTGGGKETLHATSLHICIIANYAIRGGGLILFDHFDGFAVYFDDIYAFG